jgi:hypothetical protein
MLAEQPHAQGDADDRIDDHQERLGDPERSDVKRQLLEEDTRHPARRQGVDRPAGEHSAHAELGQRVRRGLYEHCHERPHHPGRARVQSSAPPRGAPLGQAGQDSGADDAGHDGDAPVMTRRGRPAAAGVCRDDEHGEAHAGQSATGPRDEQNRLANPEPAEHEGQDQLGDQKGLHDRNQAVVQASAWNTNAAA